MHILQCGRVNVDPAMAHADVSPFKHAWNGRFRNVNKRVWLPVNTFLIECPKGLVLVDAGWHTDVRDDAKAHETSRLWSIYRPELPAGQAITEQLSALGYQPSDIDYVVMTDLDVDHASGLSMLKDAKHIIASKEEIEAARTDAIRYNPKFIEGLDIEPIDYIFSGVGPSEMTCDLLATVPSARVRSRPLAGSQACIVHDITTTCCWWAIGYDTSRGKRARPRSDGRQAQDAFRAHVDQDDAARQASAGHLRHARPVGQVRQRH